MPNELNTFASSTPFPIFCRLPVAEVENLCSKIGKNVWMEIETLDKCRELVLMRAATCREIDEKTINHFFGFYFKKSWFCSHHFWRINFSCSILGVWHDFIFPTASWRQCNASCGRKGVKLIGNILWVYCTIKGWKSRFQWSDRTRIRSVVHSEKTYRTLHWRIETKLEKN